MHLESCQTSEMERFAEVINGHISAKCSNLYIWQGFEYAYAPLSVIIDSKMVQRTYS